jgi:hypothetical protein
MAELDILRERTDTTTVPPGLRVVVAGAGVLVVYSYFVLWLNRHGYSPGGLVLIRDWVDKPTGIGDDFGVLGLALLLLVAGFRAAQGISARWLLLLVPAVVACVLLTDRLAGNPALTALIWASGVAALGVLLAVAGRALPPVISIPARLVLLGVLVLAGISGPLHHLGLLAGFAPVVVLGDVLAQVRAKRLHGVVAGAFGVLAFGVLSLTDQRYAEWHGTWYPVTVLYAGLIALLALPYGQVPAGTAVVRWLASRALWLIGTAVLAGWAVLDALDQHLPVTAALVVALVATVVLAEVGHRFVQRPLGGDR